MVTPYLLISMYRWFPVFGLFFLMLFSCNRHSKVDVRKPFEVNHKLTCEGLIENGYTRLWGEDVVLVSKEIGNTLVYYQLEYDQEEDDNGEIIPTEYLEAIGEEDPRFYERLCDNANVIYRNYSVKFDSKEGALAYMKAIDLTKYEVIHRKVLFFEKYNDRYQIINKKTKDTFNGSIDIYKHKEGWYFSSSISWDD